MLDRIGKGIRTAPRDALISLSASPKTLGTAFGVHRAMDTTGAMIGPLMAFGILALAPLAFTSVFLVSFCVAIAGLGVIVLLVPRARRAHGEPSRRCPCASCRRCCSSRASARWCSPRRCWASRPSATPSSTSRSSASSTSRRRSSRCCSWAPRSRSCCSRCRPAGSPTASAAAASSSAATCCCSRSMRRCSRRSWGTSGSDSCSRLVGASYAATDGVLAALASATLDEEARGSGLAVLTTATNLSRFVASVGFGALWTLGGPEHGGPRVRHRARRRRSSSTGVVLRSTREVAHGA